jgi:hypothetical protein
MRSRRLQVKGIEAPMQTYLVHAALDRGVASVERGLQGLATPMVGRNAELQRLLQAVERARQTRQLQALTLIGDAGLGKSRLLRELAAALRPARANAAHPCARSPTASCALGACCAACWRCSAAWPTPTAPKWPSARSSTA